jgi:hypothetical protein
VALLAEAAPKRLGSPCQRNSSRRFALRHGYSHPRPEEKGQGEVRCEMPGPGILLHHEASRHCWLPALGGQPDLLRTQDDDSRRVVRALLVPRETSWPPRQVGRQTVPAYGRPLADDVDHHRSFRWVTHQSYRDTVTTAEADARVQFRRVLRSLDMGIIHRPKGAPAARGDMAKRCDDFPRRLPFLCEQYRGQACAEGHRILAAAVAY